MHEYNIIIKTNDGNLDCHVFITEEIKNPNIIFYMDAPAIREELRTMCRKIASSGYNVILPNLFYRKGIENNYPFDQKSYKSSKVQLNKMLDTMNSTTNSMIIDDTKFIIDYLNEKFSNKNIGIVGYCMSGRFVVSCAAIYSDKIKAAASFYGVDIMTEKLDSPHLIAENIKGSLYLAFAEKDYWVPEVVLRKINNYFMKLDIQVKIEVYPGTDHGFAFPSRSTYIKSAEKKHWNKLLNLFGKNL